MGCIFCDIIAGRTAAYKVYETPDVLAFLDHKPLFPGHVLVVPRRHVVTLPELEPEEVEPVFAAARLLARAVPRALGAQGTFVAINNKVSQTVFHLHVHVVPRSKGDGLKGFFWPRNPYRDDAHFEEARSAIAQAALQEEVLDFWFGPLDERGLASERRRRRWFAQDAAVDQEIERRFGALREQALRGELSAWTATANGRLALLILLDQFSRNLFRHTERAFEADDLARALCLEGLEEGHDRELGPDERAFFYLPLEHAEDRDLQALSVRLFTELGQEETLRYAVEHQKVVDRFGRFPHRNAVLKRENTAEEAVFLSQPGSSFW